MLVFQSKKKFLHKLGILKLLTHLCVCSSDSLHVGLHLLQTLFVWLFFFRSLIWWIAWPPLTRGLLLVVLCCQNALSRSYVFNTSPLSRSHYGSCRDMHASQGSLVLCGRDGQPYGTLSFCVSTAKLQPTPAAHNKPRLSPLASFTSF